MSEPQRPKLRTLRLLTRGAGLRFAIIEAELSARLCLPLAVYSVRTPNGPTHRHERLRSIGVVQLAAHTQDPARVPRYTQFGPPDQPPRAAAAKGAGKAIACRRSGSFAPRRCRTGLKFCRCRRQHESPASLRRSAYRDLQSFVRTDPTPGAKILEPSCSSSSEVFRKCKHNLCH